MSSADLVEVKKEPLSPDTSVSEEAAVAGVAAAVTASGSAANSTNSTSSSSASASVSLNNVETALENLDLKKEVKQEVVDQGEEEQQQQPKSEDYNKLLNYGLDGKVASRLESIYITGKLSHSDLDDRALDALKEFPVDGALAVLTQFTESNLEHVSNKSAYLCGVMKTYRQKSRTGHTGSSLHNGNLNGVGGGLSGPANGGSSSSGLVGSDGSVSSGAAGATANKGPDKNKIKEILDRTGYTLDVTTGQRKYGGPPPDWEGEPPGNGCEVFCGKIPRDLYEDELIPLFEKCGKIWDLRLMMDPMTSLNRGYAFVTFTKREFAQEAVRQLNDFELRKAKRIGVTISFNNHRLFVGNIPKNRDRSELLEEFTKHAPGLREVIIYSSPDDKKKNRGFCFLEYESHKAASLAKRRLETGRVKVWSCDIIVDWADPQEEPDEDTMSQVKVLYVRNLTASVTEDKLREVFEAHGKVERVKKIKDYAFVHFEDRKMAEAAMNALHKTDLSGSDLDISLAKPPSDKKKKEEILRKREQRMMKSMTNHMPLPPFPHFPGYSMNMSAAAAGAMFNPHPHHPHNNHHHPHHYPGNGGHHHQAGQGGHPHHHHHHHAQQLQHHRPGGGPGQARNGGVMRGGAGGGNGGAGMQQRGYYNSWGGWGGDAGSNWSQGGK